MNCLPAHIHAFSTYFKEQSKSWNGNSGVEGGATRPDIAHASLAMIMLAKELDESPSLV